MPIYEFKCEKCGKVEEKIMKVSESEQPQYCNCEENAQMKQQLGAPGLQFNGRWFKNSGGY